MTSKILIEVLKKLIATCRRQKVKLVICGGMAVSVMGRPRTTYDVDAVLLVEERKLAELLQKFSRVGFKYDKREPVKNIRGNPFVTLVYSKFKTYVDLFIARSSFQKQILKRKKTVKLAGIEVPLITAEDLILMKLLSGRERDLEDVREILIENKGRLNFRYLKNWAKKLEIDIFLKDELESLRLI